MSRRITNRFAVVLVIAALSTMFGCKPKARDVEGSVFIVTKGRENVKLGLVTIFLYDATTARISFRDLLEQLQIEAEKAKTEAMPLAIALQKLSVEAKPIADENDITIRTVGRTTLKWDIKRAEMNKTASDFNSKIAPLNRIVKNFDRLCYDSLHQPITSVKTDADGKFKIQIPRSGEFIIAASASRDVGKEREEYVWIISAPTKDKPRSQIFLSNDNMTSSYSSESACPKLPFEPLKTIPLLP